MVNSSTSLARVVVRQLIEAGITDVVISPGSRNAPISLAMFAASEKGFLKLHIRIDERSAAYFALGLAKASGRPVPIVCTSGTAVANYHPAVLEAHHSNVPLLVLTADRPAILRRTGANQTTEQARIFGAAVRYFADVSGGVFPLELPIDSLHRGPVHLNLQFEEPLLPDADNSWLAEIKIAPRVKPTGKSAGTLKVNTARGVLVIGHDRGGLTVAEVSKIANDLEWPVIAEDPLSFPEATSHAALFLASPAIRKNLTPETVVIIGRTTLSRPINALIASAKTQIVIDPRMATVDTYRVADQRFIGAPVVQSRAADPEWHEQWRKLGQRTAKLVSEIANWSESALARELAKQLSGAVFIASSRPIRDIESFATARTGIETFANRGLAGIDGNISTALGIATARQSATAIIGDLAFLHDLTGLVGNTAANLRIIAINNDGGGIFSTLPQAGVAGFETVFGTPHGLDLEKVAAGLGITAKTISSFSDLTTELAKPISGVSVLVCQMPNRENNAAQLKALVANLESI
jgi:2-succinyl-5-enolpyruvyl-6-hydroxy-3-cyclohexene-1-carboxylate synthase